MNDNVERRSAVERYTSMSIANNEDSSSYKQSAMILHFFEIFLDVFGSLPLGILISLVLAAILKFVFSEDTIFVMNNEVTTSSSISCSSLRIL